MSKRVFYPYKGEMLRVSAIAKDLGMHPYTLKQRIENWGYEAAISRPVDLSKGKRGLDLTGQKFGRLTAVAKVGRYKSDRHTLWACDCECGNKIEVPINSLRQGRTKSCGCLSSQYKKSSKKRQGQWVRRYYRFNDEVRTVSQWAACFGMSRQCLVQRIDRGTMPHLVLVSKEEMGSKTNGQEYTFEGMTKTLQEWSEDLLIPYEVLRDRIKNQGLDQYLVPLRKRA